MKPLIKIASLAQQARETILELMNRKVLGFPGLLRIDVISKVGAVNLLFDIEIYQYEKE